MINRVVLSSLGFRHWMFRSNAVQVQNPEKLAEMIGDLTAQNVLVPADARKLVGELVFNRRIPRIDADWAYQPVMLTQVGVPFDTVADGSIPSRPTGGADGTVPGASSNVISMKSRREWKNTGKAKKSYGGGRLANVELREKAREMIALRAELETADREEAKKAFADAKQDEEEVPTVIRMSIAEVREKLGIEAA
jgi:hypothetical protein